MKLCIYCTMVMPKDAHPQAVYCNYRCRKNAQRERNKVAVRKYKADVKWKLERDAEARAQAAPQEPVVPKQRQYARFYRANSLAMTPNIQDSERLRGDMLTGKAPQACQSATRTIKNAIDVA